MARVLKTPLQDDTVAARRSVEQLTAALRDAGREGVRAGGDVAKAMDGAGDAAGGLAAHVQALAASCSSLGAIRRIIEDIARACRTAANSPDGSARQAASPPGAAEPAMAGLALDIARQAGGGRQDAGAVSALMAAAASAGLIGPIRPAPGGRGLALAPEDRAKLLAVQEFVQRLGRPETAPAFAQLLRKAIPGEPTEDATLRAIRRTAEAFRAGGSGDWHDFLAGASALLDRGVSHETALGRHARPAKAVGGTLAGETLRKLAGLIDRRQGGRTHRRLKRDDGDELLAAVLAELAAGDGPARDRLYGQPGVPAEQAGGLAALPGAAGDTAGVESPVRRAAADQMPAELEPWPWGHSPADGPRFAPAPREIPRMQYGPSARQGPGFAGSAGLDQVTTAESDDRTWPLDGMDGDRQAAPDARGPVVVNNTTNVAVHYGRTPAETAHNTLTRMEQD